MSTQINAAQRLLVVAEGEWWDSLTDDMRKQYIDEHPDSKYAKGYQMHKQGQGQAPSPSGQAPKAQKPAFGPQDTETQERLRRLPKPVQKFVQSGGTAKGSEARKETATGLKAQSQRLARGVVKDVAGAAAGVKSAYDILNGKPKEGDVAKVGKLIANILGASVVTAAIGATGPVGILTFLAIKHLAAPKLAEIAKNSWHDMKARSELKKKEKEAPESRSDQPQSASALDRLAGSVVTATDDEEYMKHLLDGICDYAADGEIPDDAWKAAIAELEGQQEQDGDPVGKHEQ